VTKINTITPGATGIGLGRNPSGVVPLMSADVRPIRHDPLVFVAMVAAMAGAYALRMAEVIENWPFVLLVVVAVVAASSVAKVRARPSGDEAADAPPSPDALEWVGVTEPWTTEHLSRVTEGLGLDGLPPPETVSRAKAIPVPALTPDAPGTAPSVSGNGADHGGA
jgi:branched-chain amino acid transport system permease protein